MDSRTEAATYRPSHGNESLLLRRKGWDARRHWKNSCTVLSRSLNRIAVFACRRRRIGRTLEQSALTLAAAGEATSQRVKSYAENRSARKIVHGNSVLCDGRGSVRLVGPQE